MLSDTFLSTMVQIGITGAGLVLAIYALIIPISRKMFIYRAMTIREQMELFEEQRKKLTPEATDKEFKRLQQMANAVKGTRIFPRYLGVGVLLTFGFCIFLAVSAFGPLINPANRTVENEMIISVFFSVTIISFLLLGLITIFDIAVTMKKEYERIKRKLEQDKEFRELFAA